MGGGPFGLVAVPLTVLARRSTRLSSRPWWWTSVLAWVAPFALLDVPRLVG